MAKFYSAVAKYRAWIGLLPFFVLVCWVTVYAVDIPFLDQWDIFDNVIRKKPGFTDLWAEHNEHRLFFPRILWALLAYASHWNIKWEIAANLVLGALGFLIIFRQMQAVESTGTRPLPLLSYGLTSLLFFSAAQWQTWLWGMQMCQMMQVVAALAGFACISKLGSGYDWKKYAAGVMCGIVASFSFASGLMYWPAIGVGLVIIAGRRDKQYIVSWAVITCIVMTLYFYGYTQPSHTHGIDVPLSHPFVTTIFFLMFLGSPLSAGNPALALTAGLAGLILGAVMFCGAMKKKPPAGSAYTFFLMVLIYVLLNAVFTATGRVELGINYSLVSRYKTMSALFWIALIVIIAGANDTFPLPGRRWREALWLMAVLALMDYGRGMFIGRIFSNHLAAAQAYIRTHPLSQPWDDNMLRNVYYNAERIKPLIMGLAKQKLSLFRE